MTAPFAHLEDTAARARSALGRGRLEEARQHFSRAVSQRPRDSVLLIEAAVVEGQLGDVNAAERLLEKAIKLDPDNADAWFNLGQVAREKDMLERAVRLFRKALAIDSHYTDAAFALGEALYVQGKAEEALPWLDKAVAQAPADTEILHVKALALDHLGRAGAACDAYRQVLRLQPDHVNATLNLAVASVQIADPQESLALVDGLEASGKVPSSGYAVAAQVLHFADHDERALAYAEKSLAAGLNKPEAMLTRANILRDAGDFDGAEAELRKVLEINKDSAQAYYRLAVIKRLERKAERRLLRQAENRNAPVPTRAAACFALYHLLDDAGESERAFEMLIRANALKGRDAAFNSARHVAHCERIKAVYSPQFIAGQRPHGFDKAGSVFVFGMPRSGTSLTEQILAAHPDVAALGERPDVHRAVSASNDWPEGAVGFDAATLHDQGRQVHEAMLAPAGGRRLATDKAPGNYMLAGAIACMLPNAKLVHVRRTPGDNALSLFEQSFLRGLEYSCDLGHIGAVYRAHLQLMEHWIATCGLPIHTVDYDHLVQDPEPHVRALLDAVGLDFHADCLAPQQVKRNVRTASFWQVRQPINANSVGRWRRYETQLKPFFRALEGT